MEYLQKRIKVRPEIITERNITLSGKYAIQTDDELYVENRNFPTYFYYILGGIFTLCVTPALMLDQNPTLIFSIACVPAVLCVLYGHFAPRKRMIYHRLNDKLSISRKLFLKPISIPFSTGHTVVNYYTATEGLVDSNLVFVPRKGRGVFGGILTDISLEEYWSFTVWYMDRNRPLPPGTPFDPYRRKDFERRKAEGFPRPLYPSDITTPEATPEQQAERRRIGGW